MIGLGINETCELAQKAVIAVLMNKPAFRKTWDEAGHMTRKQIRLQVKRILMNHFDDRPVKRGPTPMVGRYGKEEQSIAASVVRST